jgi:zinc protease
VSAGVDPANLEEVIKMILKELDKFTSELVTINELDDSKSNFIGRLPLSLESNAGMVGALINLERYELGLDYYQRYPELVKAVSQNEILETAQEYFRQEAIGIAAAGSF